MSEQQLLIGCLDKYVNDVLPSFASTNNWPIRFNHCFRRVIYDTICGCKWNDVLLTPGKDHLTTEQLYSCINLCLEYLKNPNQLIKDNEVSLSYRKIDHGR